MKHSKLLTILLASALTFSIGACGNTNNQDPAKTIKDIQKVDENINEEGNLETTYTITFLDGTEYTFTVKNGKDGEQGIQGEPGKDGHTPTIEIGDNGNRIIDGTDTGISSKGEEGKDGKDGNSIVSITKTNTQGLIDTYTITYSDGTTSTFTVVNGKDGEQGIQGEPGKDGKTPTIEVSENGTWIINGADTGLKAIGVNGTNGEDGKDGLSAYEIYIKYHPEYTGSEEEWIDDLINDRLGDNDEAYHTVTLDLNGGTIDGPTEFKVKKGDIIGNLPIPTKVLEINDKSETFNFVGWYSGTSVNDGKVTNITPITSDMTLIAAYSSFVNTYLDENGEIIEQSLANSNTEVINYTFHSNLTNKTGDKTYVYEIINNGLEIKDRTHSPIHVIDHNLIPKYITEWTIVDRNNSSYNEIGLMIDIGDSNYSFENSFQLENEICGLKVLDIEITSELDNVQELILNKDLQSFYCESASSLNKIILNDKLKGLTLNSLKNLKDIEFSNKSQILNFSVQYCPKIASLNLSNLSSLTRIEVSNLDNLSNLDISNLSFESLKITNCPSLYDLQFNNCSFIDYAGSMYSSIEINSNSLTKLDFSNLNYQISNAEVNFFLACPSLNELILPPTTMPNMKYNMEITFLVPVNCSIINKNFLSKINITNLQLDCSNIDKTDIYLENLKINQTITFLGLDSTKENNVIFKNCDMYYASFKNLDVINKLTFENCGNINLTNLFSFNVRNNQYLNEIRFTGNTTIAPLLEPIFTLRYFNCLTDIYFNGTQEEWEALEISESNTLLFDGSVTIHFEEA